MYIPKHFDPTKAETGKAVPTWNYVVAHAYGSLQRANPEVERLRAYFG